MDWPAARVGLPLSVSFTLDNSTSRLVSGSTLKDAIEIVDADTGDDRPAFYGINCSRPLELTPAIEPGTGSSACVVCGPTQR
jgi:homocysteine S-methyltransferase